MRKTPCESTPRRFAHTSDFAHSFAMAGATPAAPNSALVKRWRTALEITYESLLKAYPPRTTPAGEHKGRVLSIRANPRIQSLSQSCLAGFVQWLGLADRSQGNAWGNAQIALESSRTRFPLPLPANSPLERPLSAPAALPRAARYSRRPLLANAAM